MDILERDLRLDQGVDGSPLLVLQVYTLIIEIGYGALLASSCFSLWLRMWEMVAGFFTAGLRMLWNPHCLWKFDRGTYACLLPGNIVLSRV